MVAGRGKLVLLFLVLLIVPAAATMDLVIPAGKLFEVENLTPEDRLTRNLTLTNAGDVKIEYVNLSAEVEGKLSEALVMNLSYDGEMHLSTLENLSLYPVQLSGLSVGQSKVLFMEVLFPSESGDEYQGTKTEANFTFTAFFEGESGPDGGGGSGGGFFHICGDGRCSWSEDEISCPEDCATTTTTIPPEESEAPSGEKTNETISEEGGGTTTIIPGPGVAGYFLFPEEGSVIPLGLIVLGLILLWFAWKKKED